MSIVVESHVRSTGIEEFFLEAIYSIKKKSDFHKCVQFKNTLLVFDIWFTGNVIRSI